MHNRLEKSENTRLYSHKAEEVTKQRKAPKRGAGKRKGSSKAKKESSDESEAYVDITDDDEDEIFDCIEVEM